MVKVRGATKRLMMVTPTTIAGDGKRTGHVAAGTLRPRGRGAHDPGPAASVRSGPAGERAEVGQRSDALTSGPATTGRIAISHSDHLRRSFGVRTGGERTP
jgi:hypothetical protein